MSNQVLKLSPKYKSFLSCKADFEALEGTTAAGKTTVGLYKFILKVWQSPKKLHILAADDTGTAEKNIINKDLGILDDFGKLIDYNGNGSKDYKMPHLVVHSSTGDKIVIVVGYSDRNRWKDALGGQYGCLYIDEVNTANMDFVREAVMRADYTMVTLNPDDPSLPVYKEYINRCRPMKKWSEKTPIEILNELNEPEHKDWVHWFFNFDDNYGLSQEKKEQIIGNVPKGTKLWKNKVQGIRGRATGLVFNNFTEMNVISSSDLFVDVRGQKQLRNKFSTFSIGVDTAYSQKSPDTIAMSFMGITAANPGEMSKLIVLDEEVYNNSDLANPIAPSDTVQRIIEFAERNREKWGFARYIFLDSADQATITEWQKFKRQHGSIYELTGAWKKTKIIDRIHLQLGWIQSGSFLILNHCRNHIHELNVYSWKEDKYEPEDGNDHTINACQYGWLPFKGQIGTRREK